MIDKIVQQKSETIIKQANITPLPSSYSWFIPLEDVALCIYDKKSLVLDCHGLSCANVLALQQHRTMIF
ncbi:MAG: hypothetical protein K9G11_03650 [Rickettsiaceae bacterium]|nr:hypothetical protein [Rickettsiaceae bacterium]